MQAIDSLFYLREVRFVLLDIDKNIVGISAGEIIEEFIKLGVDKSLPLYRPDFKSEREDFLLESFLSCFKSRKESRVEVD